MKFDTFLATIGDWGKFQKVKYIIICLTYMLPPIMVYTYTFTAAKPDFRCRNPLEKDKDVYNSTYNALFDSRYKSTEKQCKDMSGSLSVEECQRCYIQLRHDNQSFIDSTLHKCNEFVYDRKYFKSTLVEEVIIIELFFYSYYLLYLIQWTMVCDRVIYRSAAQMVFFFGYMVGSLFFGVLADK